MAKPTITQPSQTYIESCALPSARGNSSPSPKPPLENSSAQNSLSTRSNTALLPTYPKNSSPMYHRPQVHTRFSRVSKQAYPMMTEVDGRGGVAGGVQEGEGC